MNFFTRSFAGMTLRSLAEVCNFDFFTRSNAGVTLVSGAPPPFTQQAIGQISQHAVLQDILA
jgi:hypothetical protein